MGHVLQPSPPPIFAFLLLIAINSCACQNSTSCNSFYLHTQRQGAFLTSQIKIPMSKYARLEDTQPGYRLELNFNRAIRSVNIRQVRGRDMANHRKFIIDTVPKGDEMKIHLSTVLRTMWSQNPSIIRIILNDQVICGQPLTPQEDNQTIVVNAVQRKKYHSSTPIHYNFTFQSSSIQDDEEDYSSY